MKLSIDWLKEYIDVNCPIPELADGLTMAGLEVEEIKALSKRDFVAAGGSGSRDDMVFDVKVTPNRGDWLSVIGVAREAAPLLGAAVRMPEPEIEGQGAPTTDSVKIRIDNLELCRRYVGVIIRDVKIGESPDWMKDRLIAAGMRPINNVVDITNYVMLELGQPLHAFDMSLLHGPEIIVRRAKAGETIKSIDDIVRKLEPDMLVIADADRPVAIAGVMGGADSEIDINAKDILIESANFNSVSVRRTSKRLGLVTESSYRFERGVDPSITVTAALRAAELIHDLAGGEVAQSIIDIYPSPVEPVKLNVRPERVNAVLGLNIEPKVMVDYLNGYGISSNLVDGHIECVVPTFRQDITREIDIVEEVGRAYGYDKFDTTLPKSSSRGMDNPVGLFREKVRRILMSCGCQEVLTHSLVDGKLAEFAGKSDIVLKVRNPLSEELDTMRVALIPNLLQVIERNQALGTADVCVFETGKVYYNKPDVGIGEQLSIAGAMSGNMWRNAWSLETKSLDVDFFLCKGVVESLFDGLGVQGVKFVEARNPLLHPTRAAKVLVGDVEIGLLGECSPDVGNALNLRNRACVFELDFSALMSVTPETLRYKELPRYPGLYRHMAVVVADDVNYDQLSGLISEAGSGIIETVEVLDVYKGAPISANEKSVTIAMVFRASDRTLKDEEVNAVLATIKEALSLKVGASFRE